MSAPVITFYDSTDTTEQTSLSFGSLAPGTTSSETILHIWNNKGGGTSVSDAENCSIAIKTYLGLDTGDTNANGQGVVTGKYIQSKCTSYGASTFTAIGGSTVEPIGYTTATATISGSTATPANQVAAVTLRMVIPAAPTATAWNAKLKVLYTYS